MNREIKFRGLPIQGESYIYGHYTIEDGIHYIHDPKMSHLTYSIEVIAESVGQYTGLKDKNGVDIYEDDIVKTDFKQDGSHESIQVIEFYEGSFGSRNKEDHLRIPALFSGRAIERMNLNYYEVIGNIHEHPHLLTKAEKA